MPYSNVVKLPKLGETPFDKFDKPDSPIMFPVAERPVHWETRFGAYVQSNEHKALVRVKPKTLEEPYLLNIVGRNYQLVHNRELIEHIQNSMMDQMDASALFDVRVVDRVSGFGRTCYREYIFPGIRCQLKNGTKSDIAFRMIVQNGYGGSALRIHAGAIEFYCTNGMITGEYSGVYRRHTSGLVIEDLSKTITDALETFAKSQVKWDRWCAKPVKHEAAMALLEDIARSPSMYNNLTDQYMREREARGNNLWALYSALTFYASHNDGAFKLRKPTEEQNTEAQIMLQRELSVAKWIQGDKWKVLEEA